MLILVKLTIFDIYCSFCMELNLFQHYCSICFKFMWLFSQKVKNFNICRHNVYEQVPMYGTWFINVIFITFGVRYSLNTNLNIILSISSIWLYIQWSGLFQILPHLDSDVYCTLHFNIYQSLNQLNYKGKLWHLLWRIHAKT